jgi:hypothetical protein
MRPPRFSIGSLLMLIAIVAVGMAALRYPSPLWASTIYTVAAVVLIAGVSNAILGRGARRAYWIGFALFGGAYFFLAFFTNQLLTETILDLIYPHVSLHSPQAAPILIDSLVALSPATSGPTSTPPLTFYPPPSPGASAWDHWTKPDYNTGALPIDFSVRFSSVSFRKIGHSLATLLAATLGGIFVRWRYEENSKEIGPDEAAPERGQPETAPTVSA